MGTSRRLEIYPRSGDVKEVIVHYTCREKVLWYMNHLYFTLSVTSITILSLVMMFATMIEPRLRPELLATETLEANPLYVVTDFVIMCFFFVETFLRMIMMGPFTYFKTPMCLADLFVTTLDITLFMLEYFELGSVGSLGGLVRMLRVVRISKLSRMSRLTVQVDSIDRYGLFVPPCLLLAALFPHLPPCLLAFLPPCLFASRPPKTPCITTPRLHSLSGFRGESVERDETGRIYAYNSSELFSHGWMHNLGGTVLVVPQIWVQMIFLVIITTMIATYTCPSDCDPAQGGDPANCMGNDSEACLASLDPTYSVMFMSLAAFLLGTPLPSPPLPASLSPPSLPFPTTTTTTNLPPPVLAPALTPG
jgi:hypothetical protein